MNSKKMMAAATLTVALGAGSLGVASIANAADPTSSPTPVASQGAQTQDSTAPGRGMGQGMGQGMGHGPRGDHDGRGRGGEGREDMAKDLAAKLGVSESTVTAALDKVHESLKPGTPPTGNQTQADREKQRTERETAMAKALATELKMDQSKVQTALTAIHTERDAERAKEFSTYLDTQVKAGKITAADKEVILKAAKAGVIGYGMGGHR